MIIMIVIVKGMRKKKKKTWPSDFGRRTYTCEKIHGTCIGREMLKRLKT